MKTMVRAFVSCVFAALFAGVVHAGQIGRDADLLRTGWYPNQSQLSPAAVAGDSFGQLFSTAVTGAVYGQPLVYGGILFVVTQGNWIYGLDPQTGAIVWSRNVDPPFVADDAGPCPDIQPIVGITCTPVIDDATGIGYFTSKTYVSGSSGEPMFKMHAVAVATGDEQPGFPVTIDGVADNEGDQVFHPLTQNQRPGLLLMDGVVYAAFGSICDITPYQGWVIGVSTAGAITARWMDRFGSNASGNGIWMAGSGLASDGPGQILLSTGNGLGGGTPSTPIPGDSPPLDLGEAVVRLSVQPDGSLQPVDFFTPYDATVFDDADGDIGSGGVIGLPNPPFGTAGHPNLFAEVGKPGTLYLMDASSLGGCQQGTGGKDAVVNEVSTDGGVWSKPTIWGGDGGWLYVQTADTTFLADGSYGFLRAFQAGLDHQGNPTFTLMGSSTDRFGVASGAPIVTSDGTQSGSALLWIAWNPDETGVGAELRAYDVLPVGGVLPLRFHWPIGKGPKFSPPGVDNNRLYVGTRDAHVIGFGLRTSGVPVAASGRAWLGAAYPNPCANGTAMDLTLAKDGPVAIAVFDPSGRRVRTLLEGDLPAGSRRVVWDGRDDRGAGVAAGLYLVRMDAAGVRQSRRVAIVR